MIFIQRITTEDKTMTRTIYEFQELKKTEESIRYQPPQYTLEHPDGLRFIKISFTPYTNIYRKSLQF